MIALYQSTLIITIVTDKHRQNDGQTHSPQHTAVVLHAMMQCVSR